MDFYTNCAVHGNTILYRGIEDGSRVTRREQEYQPTLFVPSKSGKPTKFKSLSIPGDDGKFLEPVIPGSIRDFRDFIKKYEDVDGFDFYGQTNIENAFISDTTGPDKVKFDKSFLRIFNIDIEVGKDNKGFPDPWIASEPVTAITIEVMGPTSKYIVFGWHESQKYSPENKDAIYFECKDEEDLLRRFLDFWSKDYPDIVTGWHINGFDIPYLINRIGKRFGEKEAKRISPFGSFYEDKRPVLEQVRSYKIIGIARFDYRELFKKFHPKGDSQESYTLQNIASVFLKEGKLSYDEYDSIFELYAKNYQKYMDYNIRDVALITKLDNLMKLIDLGLTIAYMCKVNYEDIFHQTRNWDSLCYNYLKKLGIQIPQKTSNFKDEAYEGAYVKEPKTGKYRWVISLDFTSLYPKLMIALNISPDTYVGMYPTKISMEEWLNQSFDTSFLKEKNLCIAANGAMFRTDKKGFLPVLLVEMFEDRDNAKQKMLGFKREKELILKEMEKRGMKKPK